MSSTVSITLTEVAASLALIAVAIAVSFWRRAELEQDIAVAVFRSFIQLTAVGYVIQAIFDTDSLWLVAALLADLVDAPLAPIPRYRHLDARAGRDDDTEWVGVQAPGGRRGWWRGGELGDVGETPDDVGDGDGATTRECVRHRHVFVVVQAS